MDESSNSSLGSSSGTPPTGNGVPGGGDSGFHPQQMQHQQFGAAYRPGKFQTPLGLHQQRPVMISYDQHSVPQQQGSYMHHGPYQQLLHQQQQLQFQQQQQQQQQQLHQQLQMQFPQQPENLQRSMPFIQDTQKSSSSQNQSQNLKSSNVETTNKGSSSNPSTAAVKPDSSTDDGTTKEPTQTPAEVEKLTKELESQRTAHEKQVKDLEALIASLQEQKKEKEVKYLRVGSSGPQKKKQEETSPKRKSTRSKSALNNSGDEDLDTGGDAGDIMDSCPSPVPSNVSIKEEPDDDDEYEKWAVQGIKFPRVLDEDGDTKANLKKEIGKSDPENNPPKTYTLSVTDFDLCIFCQTKSEVKMVHVTEERLDIIQSIVLNVDCEASNRLKDYILDIDLFLNNLPQYHSPCHSKLKGRLENDRKKRKNSEETNISLCIFCQEHRIKSTYSFTNKGFTSFVNDFKDLDDELIEKLKKSLNFDRIKNLVMLQSANEESSLKELKIHGWCKNRFTRKYKPKKKLNISSFEPENKESIDEIIPDEEVFELLEKRKKQKDEEMQKKLRKELPEPNKFDYKKQCVICGGMVHKLEKRKCRTIKEIAYKKISEKASKAQQTDIIKVMEYGLKAGIDLICHSKCYSTYNDNRAYTKEGIGKFEYFEMAFKPIIEEIEEPMFRFGKVFDLTELRDKFLKNLKEFNIESDQKVNYFARRIKDYYTFKNDKCRVKILLYPDNFVYSNHLSEAQVAPQIIELKKEKIAENLPDSNKDSKEAAVSIIDSANSKGKKKWRFSCSECGYKCYQKVAYQKHLKKHELKSIEEIVLAKQAMCDICGKVLKNKLCLAAHLRIHTGVKYPCSQCDKTYFSKVGLYTHEFTHSGKNMECPQCGKMFSGKLHLNKHLKRVHGTGQEFLCSICGKSFKTNDRLKGHVVKHSDDRPYVCKQCGKGFKYQSNLKTHEMAHDGKKPFMCKICSFGCYTKANLTLHMAKHTGKMEESMCSSTDLENEKYVPVKNVHARDKITYWF